MIRWVALLLALAAPASAQRAIMEGVAASRYTVKVDTVNARVLIDTTSYTGGIANVGLFVASNVVVGTLANKNAAVLYATGTAVLAGGLVAGSSISGAHFGDGSHLTGIVSTGSVLLAGVAVPGSLINMSTYTFGGGAGGHTIATGTLISGATGYPARSVLTFDSQYFTATDSAAANATFISLGSLPGAVLTATQTFSGANTFTSSVTVALGSGCVGISCRVGYSSGTLNYFSFVIVATETYSLQFSASITSGNTSAYSPYLCHINGDTTAGHYGEMRNSYPSAYLINNAGSAAELALCAGGTSNFAVSEGCSTTVSLHSLFGLNGTLLGEGNSSVVITADSATTFQTQNFSWGFFAAGPWTITCNPVAGVGWTHEAILYRVGK